MPVTGSCVEFAGPRCSVRITTKAAPCPCSPWKKSVRWVPLFRRLGDERLSGQAPSVSI